MEAGVPVKKLSWGCSGCWCCWSFGWGTRERSTAVTSKSTPVNILKKLGIQIQFFAGQLAKLLKKYFKFEVLFAIKIWKQLKQKRISINIFHFKISFQKSCNLLLNLKITSRTTTNFNSSCRRLAYYRSQHWGKRVSFNRRWCAQRVFTRISYFF